MIFDEISLFLFIISNEQPHNNGKQQIYISTTVSSIELWLCPKSIFRDQSHLTWTKTASSNQPPPSTCIFFYCLLPTNTSTWVNGEGKGRPTRIFQHMLEWRGMWTTSSMGEPVSIETKTYIRWMIMDRGLPLGNTGTGLSYREWGIQTVFRIAKNYEPSNTLCTVRYTDQQTQLIELPGDSTSQDTFHWRTEYSLGDCKLLPKIRIEKI